MSFRVAAAALVIVTSSFAISSRASAVPSPDGGDFAIAMNDLEMLRAELNANTAALRPIYDELDALSSPNPADDKARNANLDRLQTLNNRKVKLQTRMRDIIDRINNRELSLAYAQFPDGPLDVFVEGMPNAINELTYRGLITKDGVKVAQFTSPNGPWSFPLERIIAAHGKNSPPATQPSK